MHDHGHEHNSKNIGWAILINIGITVAEVIGGTLSGSLALLSDAGHNLADVISLGLSFLGEKAFPPGEPPENIPSGLSEPRSLRR
jgi:cobalt-zinc-cadmium efflux system protein